KGGDCAPPNEPPAPPPALTTQVVSHAFSNVGEFGYGIDSSPPGVTNGLPTLDFTPPNFYDAPVLDFFSYNPISSAYPRAGIVKHSGFLREPTPRAAPPRIPRGLSSRLT